MAFGVITQPVGKNYFKVESNAYAQAVGWTSRLWWPNDSFKNVDIDTETGVVILTTHNETIPWKLSFEANDHGAMIIDSVLGTEPTSNEHLQQLLADLKN